MIPGKIKSGVENSPVLAGINGVSSFGTKWEDLTRTVFERIARKINYAVTQSVIKRPFLLKDFLLFGKDEFENILFKYQLNDIEGFVDHLKNTNDQKPYIWISGKTLQCYWNNGNAKDKKLNVLLTFLEVDIQGWDNWKSDRAPTPVLTEPKEKARVNNTLNLLKKHFIGHYYRYYQKTDHSPTLIKTPFIIREDPEDIVVVDTKTLGHQYRSSYMIIRDGALYIECENVDWNEKESYIFNIGFETGPRVITGVSNTLNRKGQAVAIKNVLVRQNEPYDYNELKGIEIPYEHQFSPTSEEAKLIEFFKRGNNIITSPYCYTLDELSLLGQVAEMSK